MNATLSPEKMIKINNIIKHKKKYKILDSFFKKLSCTNKTANMQFSDEVPLPLQFN